MHFQFPPKAETKIVRCTRGAIVDIIVDLRPESPTYLESISVELNEENGRALYVPERFAHGYQTLVDATETSYQVGEFYAPETEGGLAYDDPRLGARVAAPRRGHLREGRGVGAARRGRAGSTQAHDASGGGRGGVILVDTALRAREAEGNPIRVGMVGAGFMGQGLTNQIVNSVPGMRMVAVSNRNPDRARQVFALRRDGARARRRPVRARGRDPLGAAGVYRRSAPAVPQRAGRRRVRGHGRRRVRDTRRCSRRSATARTSSS